MSQEPLTTEEFNRILKEHLQELVRQRNETNSTINEVINEVRLDHQNLKQTVTALEKNYIELKNIAETSKQLLEGTLASLTKTVEAIHKDLKEHKEHYYQSPAVVYWKVQEKRIQDLEQANIKQDEITKEHGKTLDLHAKWFYISFGGLIVGKAVWELFSTFGA